MSENRVAPRAHAKQPGRVIIGRTEVECTIRDVSATGARLSFRHPLFLPRMFRLRFDGRDHLVTVVWQGGLFAGVRFQTPDATLGPARRRFSFWKRRG
jgi:hypothetical protein